MILTVQNLAPYLLERSLLEPAAIVDGDLIIADASRRNRNFKVLRRSAPGLFVKQVQSAEPGAASLLQREAACYWLAGRDDGFAALARLAPRFVDYDPQRRSLVIELLAGAENLNQYHRRVDAYPTAVGEQLGRALGTCHRQVRAPRDEPRSQVFPGLVAWILGAHRLPRETYDGYGVGAQGVLDVVRQRPDLQRQLDALAAGWRRSALIHGDVKWDNCLLQVTDDGVEVKLIDWELADVGDPLWDAGAVFAAYLAHWALGRHHATTTGDATGAVELGDLRPALGAFWRAYADELGGDATARSELQLAVRYGAGRLVQTAFEHAAYLPRDPAPGRLLLQLAANILARPEGAVRHLIGL